MAMTLDEKWAFVDVALIKMREFSDEFDAARKPLMLAPESPLVEPLWRTQSLAIDALEKLVGDENGNINWYAFECDFGRDAKEAGCTNNMHTINTVEQLRWLCELECT